MVRIPRTIDIRERRDYVKGVEFDADFFGRLKNFSLLAPQKRSALAAALTTLRIKRRVKVFVTEQGADQVYVVLHGLLQVTDPARSVTSIVGPGEIFGMSGMMLDQPALFYYRALADSLIGRIAPDDFVNIVLGVRMENLGLILDFVFRQWWGGAVSRRLSYAGLSVEHRVSLALNEIGAKFGVRDSRGTILNAPISHDAIAELIGASRTKTTEAIGKLTRTGRVIRDRRRLIVVDEKRAVPAGRDGFRTRVSG